MNRTRVRNASLPYIRSIFDSKNEFDSAVSEAFAEHVHWGYWNNPESAKRSAEDFAEAARQLAYLVIEAAKIENQTAVLDAGCGFGGTISIISKIYSGLNIAGLNIDINQLKYARSNITSERKNRVHFETADACTLPYKKNTFDSALAVESIFHFPNREKFFSEIFRVLKPCGRLAISDFIPVKYILPQFWFAWKGDKRSFFGDFDLRYTIEDYRKLAEKTGFKIVYQKEITKYTLPTFAILLDLAPELTKNDQFSIFQIKVLRFLSRLRLLNYYIIAFEKLDK